jgi:hypothetical protein
MTSHEAVVGAVMLALERHSRSRHAGERALAAIKEGRLSTRFAAIKEVYEINMPQIMRGEYDPYLIDWTRFFTPIEDDAWGAIRYYGVPFYPQYPALRYFLDFADPVKKIALECDGKQWHNTAKDRRRDEELAEDDWRVFRVTGAEARASLPSRAELREQGIEGDALEWCASDWLLHSVDGVVAAIAEVYYRKREECEPKYLETLDRHRLARFDLNPWE